MKSGTVRDTGAKPGAILVGTSAANLGLQVRVHRAQPRGEGGRLVGSLTLLAEGTGTYSSILANLIGRDFASVAELLDEVASEAGGQKARHILNANMLAAVEPSAAPR